MLLPTVGRHGCDGYWKINEAARSFKSDVELYGGVAVKEQQHEAKLYSNAASRIFVPYGPFFCLLLFRLCQLVLSAASLEYVIFHLRVLPGSQIPPICNTGYRVLTTRLVCASPRIRRTALTFAVLLGNVCDIPGI